MLAPGRRSPAEAPLAAHHLLRAHAAGVQAYRAAGGHQVGLVVNLEPKYPASGRAEDLAAAARADAYMNRQYLDPVFLGRYPDELAEIYGDAWPEPPAADFELIRTAARFPGGQLLHPRGDPRTIRRSPAPGRPGASGASVYTETGWEVYPRG